ncbi:MAG: tetratricopeptide repeat protein [Lysobacterales bacterium]
MNKFKYLVLLGCLLSLPLMAANKEEVNYLDLAALMLRDGNLDRAVIALDQVDVDNENTDLLRYYTLRGMAYLRRNEPELAAPALEKAVATGTAESVVYVYLAQVYFQLERYRDVLNTLDAAGPELAKVASVYHMRAQCYWLLQEPAMALATLDTASDLFPQESGFLRRKVFFLIELRLYREAAELGRIYLQESAGKREDYVALGNAMRAGGELDEAIVLLEQARLMYPGDADVNKVLARAYLDKGQVNTAAELIYEASLLDPSLTGEASELYRRAGRPHRALMLNGQISDQQVKFRQRLALLLELQRYEQVAAMDRDLTRVGLIDDEDILYALAYAEFKTGDFEATERHLQKLTRPDLFRKAAELRRVMQDCSGDRWQCL